MLRGLDRPRQRREAGLFLVEGSKMTAEAVSLGLCRVLLVQRERAESYRGMIEAARHAGAECILVSAAVMEGLSTAKTPQGVLCAAAVPVPPEQLEGALLLALDGVQDPGNLGTMLHTADAAGFSGVLLGEGCADPYGAKALRATMGSIFRLPILQMALAPALALLRGRGYAILSTELGGEDFYAACPDGGSVLVIGSEGRGVSPEVRREATHRLALPMRGGAESLNAAVAAGIMMYELSRRTKGV